MISGNKCAYFNCGKSRRDDPKLHQYRFPKHQYLSRQWVVNSGNIKLLELSPESLYKHHCACSDHFEDKDFVNPITKRKLKKGVVPKPFKSVDLLGSLMPSTSSDSPSKAVRPEKPCTSEMPEIPFLLPNQISSVSGNSERVASEEFSVGSTVKEKPKTSKKDHMNKKIPSVVFSDAINRRVRKPKAKEKESATTCRPITTPPSIDSNIEQNDSEFVTNKVGDTTAKELLDIKEESELYCRICLCVTTDFNSHIHIFPSNGENSCRQNKIQEMINQVMPDLDLSLTYNPGICIDCENRLISAYDFVSLGIQNQKTLMDYKCKHGDDTYVNIQDVVKTFDNTLNKRPLTDLTDVPSKKLKTIISINNQTETKCDESDIQHQDITIKEELDCENSNEFIESTEVINNEAITEQSCNRLLSTSADKDNYCNLKYINVAVPTLKQTTSSISEKSGEERNTSDEVQTYGKKLVELKSSNPVYYIVCRNTKDLFNNTEFEGTGMNVIQTNTLDTSNS